MSVATSRGSLMISVDIEPHHNDPEATRQSAAAGEQILSLLSRHGLAATWALTEPSTAPLRKRLVDAKQEIALLGDASWIGRSAGRTRFARELSRRITAARTTHLPITTLALRGVVLQDGLDLVVRNGITSLRGETSGLSRDVQRRPTGEPYRMLHFGVWEFPTAVTLPAGGAPIWRNTWSWRLRRGIDRAARHGQMLQLLIETPRITGSFRRFMSALDRLLHHAVCRQQQGTLLIETLAQAAHRLSDRGRSAPVRSILRAA